MSDLEQEIIDAANEVTEAKLLVVAKEQALREIVRRAVTDEFEERVKKFKLDAAPAKVKSIQKKAAAPGPDLPKPPTGARSSVKQKIIDALRASTVPLSISILAERAGTTTTNAYYHLHQLREAGSVRLLTDGYELVSKAQKEAA